MPTLLYYIRTQTNCSESSRIFCTKPAFHRDKRFNRDSDSSLTTVHATEPTGAGVFLVGELNGVGGKLKNRLFRPARLSGDGEVKALDVHAVPKAPQDVCRCLKPSDPHVIDQK
ncbi:uncharacterized protein PAC_06206 [Phialocephala subalpina]|uniref:Uncharacterized protein n=1 Tax=Phialocephala subalpina TaxID=576137 RepID=A0A1L7WU77_9HELO|nr:uncharacterized protein PAC_06206 [Phialocephala subalpina]